MHCEGTYYRASGSAAADGSTISSRHSVLRVISAIVKLYVPINRRQCLAASRGLQCFQKRISAGLQLKDFTWYEYLFTQFRVIWLYLRLYVLRSAQNGDYDVRSSRTIFDDGRYSGLDWVCWRCCPCVAIPAGIPDWLRSVIFGS